MVFASFIAASVSLACGVGQLQDAPSRLITPQGVEIVADGRLFVLFAALNGLGYSEETEKKGPPLSAPVFHPLRTQVREAMRKLDDEGKLGDLHKFIDQNPAPVEHYIEVVLARDFGAQKTAPELSPAAKKLEGVLPLLEKLGAEAALQKIYDDALSLEHKQALELFARLDKSFEAAKKHLGLTELKPALELTVYTNALDAQGSVRTVKIGTRSSLVVGPGLDSADNAVLVATLRGKLGPEVSKAYARSDKLKKAWADLKGFKSITAAYTDGDAYAAETLADVLAFQAAAVAAGQNPATKEEDFIDANTKAGLRWTRAVLRALDGRNEPIDAALQKVMAKVSP
ncbi:MAG: hypothetical protein U1E65_14870 [Myxococcota bacterium]